MRRFGYAKRWAFFVALTALAGTAARADEGGVSYWLPGQYGSFAAIAPAPGAPDGVIVTKKAI